MGRMLIFYRWNFNSINHAIHTYYGALIQISLGYSPVKGRLHTRYAPVRRSHSSEELYPSTCMC